MILEKKKLADSFLIINYQKKIIYNYHYILNHFHYATTNVSVDKLQKLIPNKASLYRILVKYLNYYLPEENSKAITESYLLGVLRGQFYSLKISEKKRARFEE